MYIYKQTGSEYGVVAELKLMTIVHRSIQIAIFGHSTLFLPPSINHFRTFASFLFLLFSSVFIHLCIFVELSWSLFLYPSDVGNDYGYGVCITPSQVFIY